MQPSEVHGETKIHPQPLEIQGGAEIPLHPLEDPALEQGNAQSVTPWESRAAVVFRQDL